MTDNRRFDETGPGRLAKLWPVLVGFLLAAMAYGSMRAQLDETSTHETRISRLEEAVSTLPEIRADVKELLRRTP